MKFCISFGYGHKHEYRGHILNHNVLFRIDVPSEKEATEKAYRMFGNSWSMLYREKDVRIEFFPHGIVEEEEEEDGVEGPEESSDDDDWGRWLDSHGWVSSGAGHYRKETGTGTGMLDRYDDFPDLFCDVFNNRWITEGTGDVEGVGVGPQEAINDWCFEAKKKAASLNKIVKILSE